MQAKDTNGTDDESESDHEYQEPDHSFGMAVVLELAERGAWGAIHATADHAADMSGLGPVAVAKELGVPADPSDKEAVTEVVESTLDFWADHIQDREYYGESVYYGPSTDADGDGQEQEQDQDQGPYPEKPSNAVDNHYRLNAGGNYGSYDDEIPGHRVFAELDRLEQAEVVIMDHRVVETADDVHPDYLEIQYGGVSADEIEKHRYRHIDSTRHYGVASRPLSEIPAHSQERQD